MSLGVYVNFNGNCREAVEFYSKAFDTPKTRMMTYGDMPPQEGGPAFSDEQKKCIMHTDLQIAGGTIMFSDVFPDMNMVVGNNVTIFLTSKNEEEIKKWYENLKDGANILMPLQATFWSSCYGMLYDKFGVGWQLSSE